MKPAETGHLQDFENRNNTSKSYIVAVVGIVTLLQLWSMACPEYVDV